MPWLPDYPDFARAAPDATAPLGALAFVPDLASFPLPSPLPWAPVYPDFARAAPDPNEWRGTPFAFLPDLASFPLPSPLVWQGHYEDFARGAERPVDPGWIGYVRVEAAAVPPLAWAPDYPAEIMGAAEAPGWLWVAMTPFLAPAAPSPDDPIDPGMLHARSWGWRPPPRRPTWAEIVRDWRTR